MKKSPLLLGAIVLSVAMLSGCTTTLGDQRLSNTTRSSLRQKLVRGRTTESQTRELLGDPTKTTFTSHGDTVWTYSLMTAHATAKNYVLSALSDGFAGNHMKQHEKTVTMLFDRRKVLMRYSYSDSDYSAQTH